MDAFLPAMLGLAGVALVLLATSKYGVGLSPDSVEYISSARGLLSTGSLIGSNGSPYDRWPPLFPSLLALVGLTGVDPLLGARFLNAVVFGSMVFVSGWFLRANLRSRALALFGTCWITLSAPLLAVSVMAWTEPLFALLVVVFVACLVGFLSRGGPLSFLLLSGVAALLPLQRYIGVVAIPTAVVLMLLSMNAFSWRRRLMCIAAFVALSGTPIAAWLVRNYALTSTFAGGRPPAPHGVIANAGTAIGALGSWLMPVTVPSSTPLAAAALAVWVPLAVLIRRLHRADMRRADSAGRPDFRGLAVKAALLFVSTYVFVLVVAASVTLVDPISDRLLAPAFVLLVFLALVAADAKIQAGVGRGLVVGLLAFWLVLPAHSAALTLGAYVHDGAGGYNTVAWRQSPLMAWLQATRSARDERGGSSAHGAAVTAGAPRIYTNAPDAVYILAGIASRPSPYRVRGIARFRKALSRRGPNYIVWFRGIHRRHLRDVEEFVIALNLHEVRRFADGSVYLVAKGGSRAGVAASSRRGPLSRASGQPRNRRTIARSLSSFPNVICIRPPLLRSDLILTRVSSVFEMAASASR